MTLDNIQSTLADAPCVATVAAGQQEWLQTILLWKILNGDTPMTGGDIQDLMNDSACIAGLTAGQNEVIQTQLLWLIFLGGGGGTGAVCLEGDNYCFSGTCPNQVFKVKNLDTGLANRLDTIGADGLQTITTDVGSSC